MGLEKQWLSIFGEQLSGFDSTINKQVQSYESLYAKSLIIYGVVSQSKALIVLWFLMVQSMAKRLMKGMLTEHGHHSTFTTAHLPFIIISPTMPSNPPSFRFYYFPHTGSPVCMATFTSSTLPIHETHPLSLPI
ncbi:hypothetical protein VitviT2T_030066 [Vitis vinifera]|uniref:Cobalamin-independent methionine synthase MetE C-terminal/archaeal domain-containing protein n=1 Tax=Vitis vinifera TaxID=29760 RepID=A0ABY9E190_VITVI|nr:hypothetical protein VitviT2T_030066 [Vitis vinifera]